jgi:hypothetical protein
MLVYRFDRRFAPEILGRTGGFALGGRIEIRHAIGAISWPTEEPVISISTNESGVLISGALGVSRQIRFDTSFI